MSIEGCEAVTLAEISNRWVEAFNSSSRPLIMEDLRHASGLADTLTALRKFVSGEFVDPISTEPREVRVGVELGPYELTEAIEKEAYIELDRSGGDDRYFAAIVYANDPSEPSTADAIAAAQDFLTEAGEWPIYQQAD